MREKEGEGGRMKMISVKFIVKGLLAEMSKKNYEMAYSPSHFTWNLGLGLGIMGGAAMAVGGAVTGKYIHT